MTTLKKAIATYGKDMQLTVAVEEFSELIKEICKNKRGSDNRNNIIEEMADCYIMLQQMMIIFGITTSELRSLEQEKMVRLEKRLAERSEKENRELKPCPFCGDKATLWKDLNADRPFHILCGCGGRVGWFLTEQEAINAWNRRAENGKS